MKTILKALILMSLSLSFNLAMSAEAEDFAAAPTDAVANPPASNPGNDADVKGTITPPTAEQKENVAKPVKKAHAKKAKKEKAAHKAHAKKNKKKKVKRATSSEDVTSGTTTASPPHATAKKAKKKTKKDTHARHPHTPNT